MHVARAARPVQDGMCRSIARHAIGSLWDELALHPKPGLVSLRDAGAHDDMNASTFIASLFALSRHFDALAAAGAARAPFATLREIGIRAEADMLAATGGINTHRGAIFALGLLCAAAGRAAAINEAPTDAMLRRILRSEWCDAIAAAGAAVPPFSHGASAAWRHGVAGARGEACAAFPAVFEVALPALRRALARGRDARLARLSALFALLESVADTNVLHRGGSAGLALVQRRAREFRSHGDVYAGDAIPRALAAHREFVDRGLSPGGTADLLAASMLVHRLQRGVVTT